MEELRAEPDELIIHKSPEKIDQAVELVPLKLRLLIGLITFILLIIIIWSVTASVNVYVNGKGILTKEQGISEIKLPYPGKISQLHVNIGQQVEQGEVLATVEQLDLAFTIKKLEAEIRELNKSLDWLLENRSAAKRSSSLSQLQQELNTLTASINQPNRGDTAANTGGEELEKMRKDVYLKIVDLENFNPQRILDTRSRLISLETELQFSKNQLNNQTQIISPYSGTIIDMSVTDGDIFSAGTSLFVIENQDYKQSNLVALVYMNAYEGKKVKPGMKVQLLPSTVAPEEAGYMLGTVLDVSKYAQTQGGMNRVLRNQQLLEEFSRDGLPMLVTVSIHKDSTSFSGYQWTTGKGPATEIVSGTLIKAKVITATKKPISFVLPL